VGRFVGHWERPFKKDRILRACVYLPSFLAGDSGLVARALEQNTTLTSVILHGDIPKEFYDAFAVVLLINTHES
jgi:hypothetical protein